MIRYILAVLLFAASASAASVQQYKGGFESGTCDGSGSVLCYVAQKSTQCNVATNSFCSVGTAFDNTSGKYINALAVFIPGTNWSPTGGPLSCWLLPSWDGGTTYETTPSALATVRQPDFSVQIQAATTTQQTWTADGIVLKPGYQKVVCYNLSGATIPSGAVLYLYPYSVQMN